MSKAVQIRQQGGPEQMELVDVQVGEPGPGEIRIRHKAIGLNFIDVYQRSGLYQLQLPATLGMEASGMEPWTILAEAAALTAHVRYAETDDQRAERDRLVQHLLSGGRRLFALPDSFLDYPVAGMLLAAVGAWLLDRDVEPEAGIRLLVMAQRFSYNQTFPVMAWDSLSALAERRNPGRLDAVMAEYADRPPADLVEETRVLLSRVGATSSS